MQLLDGNYFQVSDFQASSEIYCSSFPDTLKFVNSEMVCVKVQYYRLTYLELISKDVPRQLEQ